MTTVPPYEAIRNLLGTYCRLIDAGDFTALGELFAEGVLLDERGRVAAKGAEAATALWTAVVRVYDDGTPHTRHTTQNPVIELHEDGTAVCLSSFVVFQQVASRLETIVAGRYRDTFGARDGVWHFTSRQFFLDQVGDVSHHMAGM
ncbi:MAG TPA: nuclear transport factor 2 family protein [Mycobacteriales bacterium]|nr:nuclear transport factor 2 family protein [Mycobacteriales bacterium]